MKETREFAKGLAYVATVALEAAKDGWQTVGDGLKIVGALASKEFRDGISGFGQIDDEWKAAKPSEHLRVIAEVFEDAAKVAEEQGQ